MVLVVAAVAEEDPFGVTVFPADPAAEAEGVVRPRDEAEADRVRRRRQQRQRRRRARRRARQLAGRAAAAVLVTGGGCGVAAGLGEQRLRLCFHDVGEPRRGALEARDLLGFRGEVGECGAPEVAG